MPSILKNTNPIDDDDTESDTPSQIEEYKAYQVG
jgi:hypothetical protein